MNVMQLKKRNYSDISEKTKIVYFAYSFEIGF